MFLLKYLPVAVLGFMTIFTFKAGAEVKSYREWKSERIQQAETNIQILKSQIDMKRGARTVATGTDPNLAAKMELEAVPSQDISLEKMERDLKDELYDLEVAKDLSVTDYFVGYLIKANDQKSAFNEVAGKLSPDEVAELMSAYANSVFGVTSTSRPADAKDVLKEGGR